MRFDIILENEDKSVIEAIGEPLFIETSVDLTQFKLLRYLDTYGDTVFNKNQLDDLITDLRNLASLNTYPVIEEIIRLAEQCKNETHSYLCFSGD